MTHTAGLQGWQSLEQRQAGWAPPSARSAPQIMSSPGPGRGRGPPPTAAQRNQGSQPSLSRQAHWEPFATTPWEPSPGTIVPWSHGSFSWGLLPGQLPLFLQPGRGWGSRVARCGLRSGKEPGRLQGSAGSGARSDPDGPRRGGTPGGARKKWEVILTVPFALGGAHDQNGEDCQGLPETHLVCVREQIRPLSSDPTE